MGSKQDLLQSKSKSGYGKQVVIESTANNHNNNAYTYNKRKEYYGSNSKLPNDTYESVCAPEDTEERNQAAQRNGNAMMMMGTNNNNSNNNNNRLLKRVVSAPVGIETPKGELLLRARGSFATNLQVAYQFHFYQLVLS